MGWEEDIRSFLLADAGVVSEIGTRLHPDELPQDTDLPAISYQEVSEDEEELIDASSSGLQGTLVQFSAWARTVIEARDARQSVIDALLRLGLDPTVGSPAVSIGVLRGANKLNMSGHKDPATKFFRRGVDFRIWHA